MYEECLQPFRRILNEHEQRRQARRSQLQSDKKNNRRQKIKSAPIFVAVGIVLFIGLLVLADWGFNINRVHYGVAADAYKLGGKSKSEAQTYLDGQIKASEKNSVVVTHEKSNWKISPADVGLSFDTEAIVESAYSVGRKGSFWDNAKTRVSLYFKRQTVALRPSLNSEKTDRLYSTIQAVTDAPPKDSTVELVDGAFKITEGHEGKLLNVPQLTNDISKALLDGTETIVAPVQRENMGITKAEAQQAIDEAMALSNAEVEVKFEDKSQKFAQKDLIKLFSFGRSDVLEDSSASANFKPAKMDGQEYLIPYIASSKVEKTILSKIGTDIGKAPINARFSVSGGSVSIIPSQEGTGADPNALALDLIKVLESKDVPKSVSINTHAVQPEITTEKAKGMGINSRISSYTTTFPSGNKPRVANIKLLARSLDGKLIAPGATFSFNETVGQRTAEKGYKEAGAIVNGEIVPQLGGGICQVNTTLFNTVLLSGMPITQRRNHSYYISSYPVGRDATVSWGGPDFKFVNKSDTWVMLASSVTNGSVTMSVYGTDPGYEIKLKTSDWLTTRDYPVKEIPDPKLKVGTKVVETSGIKGGKVVLTRTVLKDGKVVDTSTYTSNYAPRAQVVRVGTKEVKPKATDSTNVPVTPTP